MLYICLSSVCPRDSKDFDNFFTGVRRGPVGPINYILMAMCMFPMFIDVQCAAKKPSPRAFLPFSGQTLEILTRNCIHLLHVRVYTYITVQSYDDKVINFFGNYVVISHVHMQHECV